MVKIPVLAQTKHFLKPLQPVWGPQTIKMKKRSLNYSFLSVSLILLSFSSLQNVKYNENNRSWPKLNPFLVLKPIYRDQKPSKLLKTLSKYTTLPVVLFLMSIGGLKYLEIWWRYQFWTKLTPFRALRTPAWRAVYSKTIKIVRNRCLEFHHVGCSCFIII